MNEVFKHVAWGARSLAARPAFSVLAVVTLGLGIGGGIALFSVVHAVLLRPLPYPEPERLVKLWETNLAQGGAREMTSTSNLQSWREDNRSFEGIAAWQRPTSLTLTGEEPAVELKASMVTGNYFEVLGVAAALGRTFGEEETAQGAGRVVAISDGFWRRSLGADPSVVGSTIQLEEADFKVLGVLPRGFTSPAGEADLWLPIRFRPNEIDRGQTYLQVLARLRPGVLPAAAQAELDGVASNLAATFPASSRGRGIEVVSLLDDTVGGVRPTILTVMVAVSLALLIACANVANLFLLRASERQHEMAIRAALGATRRHFASLLLGESALISLCGGAMGLTLAAFALRLLKFLEPADLPRLAEVQIDGPALLLTAALCLLTSVVFSLVQARRPPGASMRAGLAESGARGLTAGRGKGRLQGALVVSQIALTLVLLVGAGLLTRSLTRLLNVDPGFRADGVVVARVSLGADYESNDRSIPYFQQISDRLRRIPGVAGAGAVTVLPMNPFGIDFDVPYHRPDEGEPARAEAPKARFRAATPGYFEAIGMNLRAGRGFSDRDRRGSPNVVIVNQALADKAFGPGRSAVGEALRFFWSNWQSYEVIGVVADARSYGLASGPSPELFVPHAQIPYTVMNVVVRTTGEQAGLPDVVKSVFLSLDPQQPVQAVVPMKDLISNSTARERFAFIWLSALAFLALALATIGTYSVVSYLTAQRSREIALRLTLGATPGQIVALSMRRGAALASVGVGLGLVGSWALGRLVASLLYQVEATDPVTFVAVSALLFAATLCAAWVPARRATRVDPIAVLHEG